MSKWQGQFKALKQGWMLLSHELSDLYPIGGLEDTWKSFPQSRVKIKMVPSTFLYFQSHVQGMKIFLSHLINVRSVNNLNLLTLHSLTYQPHRYLSSVSSIKGQVWKKINLIFKLDIFKPSFSNILAKNLACMCDPVSCEYTIQEVGTFNFSFNYRYTVSKVS